jgi:hypothetical protein
MKSSIKRQIASGVLLTAYLVALFFAASFIMLGMLFVETIIPWILLAACGVLALVPSQRVVWRRAAGLAGLMVGGLLALAAIVHFEESPTIINEDRYQALAGSYLPCGVSLLGLTLAIALEALSRLRLKRTKSDRVASPGAERASEP